MPLSSEVLARTIEWRLAAGYVDIDDPKEAGVALTNIAKGPYGVMIERGLSEVDITGELTEIMDAVVRAIPPKVLHEHRERLRRELATYSEAEIKGWIIGGIVPWEKPIWTEELIALGRTRGLSFPWD